MRRWIAILLLLVPSSAFAWGAKGHRIIAAVAERRLKESAPDALKRALDLLGERHLANVAMLADDWSTKFKMTPTAAWHFVNIPIHQQSYIPGQDCLNTGCVVGMVNLFRDRVGNPQARLQRKEALIYLIHLVGDINQGWHCANGKLSDDSSDENGTRIRVKYKGGHVPGNRTGDPRNDNLHFFWDVSMLEIEGRSEKAMVEHLFGKEVLGNQDPNAIVEPNMELMAAQTRSVAEDSVVPDGTDLDEKYLYDEPNLHAMDYQLLRAGLTLAHIIKYAFQTQ